MHGPLNEAGEAARRLRNYRDGLAKVQEAALRAAAWKVVFLSQEDFRSRGIGRALWGGAGGNLKARSKAGGGFRYVNLLKRLMYLEKTSSVGLGAGAREMHATFRITGIPAAVAGGDRLKAHDIETKRRKALAFSGPGGAIFATRVKHPGARFHAWDFIGPNARKLPSLYAPAFEKKDRAFRKKVGLS